MFFGGGPTEGSSGNTGINIGKNGIWSVAAFHITILVFKG